MKKTFLILVISIFLFSCVQSPAKIGDNLTPFIVVKIEYVGYGWCEYTGHSRATINYEPGNRRPVLILPTGMFNVGDTININNFVK